MKSLYDVPANTSINSLALAHVKQHVSAVMLQKVAVRVTVAYSPEKELALQLGQLLISVTWRIISEEEPLEFHAALY